MKKITALYIMLLLTLCLSAQNNDAAKLYVGTFTSEGSEGIYLCKFNESTGEISLQKVFKGIDNPSFLQISPDRNFLYAVTRPAGVIETSGGYVQAYKLDETGDLGFINKQGSNGNDPCHIDISPDGNYTAIAAYGGGTVSLYKINQDGSLDAASSTIINEGSGPNKSRQTAPHAHSVLFSHNGKQLFSADLGTDRLNIFDLKKEELVPAGQSHMKLAPGAGPRHFRFHPDGKTVYVINELNSTVTVFQKSGKKWKEEQTVSNLPEGFTGTSYSADIHISNDGHYLYGSNRGHNSIAVFKIKEKSNRLDWVTSVSTRGDWPRNFTLSPNGKFLLAANQKSGNIAVFKINPENGIPEFTGNEVKIPSPVCLEFR